MFTEWSYVIFHIPFSTDEHTYDSLAFVTIIITPVTTTTIIIVLIMVIIL